MTLHEEYILGLAALSKHFSVAILFSNALSTDINQWSHQQQQQCIPVSWKNPSAQFYFSILSLSYTTYCLSARETGNESAVRSCKYQIFSYSDGGFDRLKQRGLSGRAVICFQCRLHVNEVFQKKRVESKKCANEGNLVFLRIV